jgi:hypothetical protein
MRVPVLSRLGQNCQVEPGPGLLSGSGSEYLALSGNVPIDKTIFPRDFQIDYVRVYQQN